MDYKKLQLNKTFRPMSSVQKAKISGKRGVMSVILLAKNGKRILLSAELCNKLGLHEKVYLMHDDDSIVICAEPIQECGTLYRLREAPANRKVIYCAELVAEIARLFSLDFSDCVCRTLGDVEYAIDADEDVIYAIVRANIGERGESDED